MATKVKGEAIKEGSIPLSALATEVKDKIENAGGDSDWAAQEGETGYIENRTHYRIRSSFIDSYNGATIGSIVLGTQLPIMIVNDSMMGNSVNPREIIVDKLDIEFNVPSVGPGIKAKITYDGTNYIYEQLTAFGVVNVLKFYSVFVQPLQDCYIPNTVIKTTSQTLSDDDKNQALANLGIDPVVWKYLCSPITIVNGNLVPNEILNEDGTIKTQYHKPAMYLMQVANDIVGGWNPNYPFEDMFGFPIPVTRVDDIVVSSHVITSEGLSRYLTAAVTPNEDNTRYIWSVLLDSE